MLAAAGFTVLALLFGIYGYISRGITKIKRVRVRSYSYAYYCLAAACVAWLLAAVVGGQFLPKGVILGDVFVAAGSICLIDALQWSKKYRWAIVGLASVTAYSALLARSWFSPVDAYVEHGVLIFNSPRVVAALFMAAFALLWFPITMHVVRTLLESRGFIYLVKAAVLTCFMSVVGVVGFISATTVTGAVTFFVLVCLAYASLIAISSLVRKEAPHGK